VCVWRDWHCCGHVRAHCSTPPHQRRTRERFHSHCTQSTCTATTTATTAATAATIDVITGVRHHSHVSRHEGHASTQTTTTTTTASSTRRPHVTIFVVNSLTGNTLLAAQLMAHGAQQQQQAQATIREIHWRDNDDVDDDEAAVKAVAHSSIVGVGVPAMCYRAPRRTVAWLARLVRGRGRGRSSTVAAGCAWFVFTTYGTHPGTCLADLEGVLRSCGARVVAAVAVPAPDSFAWFAPPQQHGPGAGTRSSMRWTAEAARTCIAFGASLVAPETISSSRDCQSRAAEASVVGRVLAAMPERVPRILLGAVKVDAALCVRCGHCVALCPVRALVAPAAGAGVPLWSASRCLGCALCIASCPAGALRAPCVSRDLLAFHRAPLLPACVDVEDLLTDGSRFVSGQCAVRRQTFAMVARFVFVGVFRRPLASLHAAFVFVVALLAALVC
jgi:Pyruvate/2-oxoacid:ferredoxin oxidoreductase delta subunit